MRSRLSKREVEAFAAAVDGQHPDRVGTHRSDRLRDLIDVATLVRERAAPTARSDFVASLRSELMATARTELAPPEPTSGPERTPAKPRARRRLALAATGFVTVGGSIGLVASSTHAMPGEMLYPVKRTTERVELWLNDGVSEGRILLKHAGSRLDEAESLAASGSANSSELIAQALTEFTNEANRGGTLLVDAYLQNGSVGAIEDVRSFTSGSADRLRSLARRLPASVATEYATATQALTGLDSAAVGACATCASGAPPIQLDTSLVSSVETLVDETTKASPPMASATLPRELHTDQRRPTTDSRPQSRGQAERTNKRSVADEDTDPTPTKSGRPHPKNDDRSDSDASDKIRDRTGILDDARKAADTGQKRRGHGSPRGGPDSLTEPVGRLLDDKARPK